MIIAFVFSVIPTLFFFWFFQKIIKSFYLKLSFSWLCGQYILALSGFLLAVILSLVARDILAKVVSILFVALVVLGGFLILRAKKSFCFPKIKLTPIVFGKAFLLVAVFLFAYSFYGPHLALRDSSIFVSPTYWDFQWHAPLIQDFVFGDNFPAQNESFAGVPATYHYFWGFLVALYSATGLDLIMAINLISIATLLFLLTAIVGFGEEVFGSFPAGIISLLLAVTSSSLRFVSYFFENQNQGFLLMFKGIFTNISHPFFFSFISGNPFGYNGSMFNLFYFLEERQMVFGMIFLLFMAWVLFNRRKISNLWLMVIGLLGGIFFLWHLFIAITVLCSFLFLLVFDKDRRKTLVLLVSFGTVFLLFLVYFKSVVASFWFYPDIASFPKINFNFPTFNQEYPLSLLNALGYYVFAYGAKIPVFIMAAILLFRANRRLFWALISVVLPTFILVNSVQLSPLSIYDNHKWLRPMNVVVDLVVGFALYKFLTLKMSWSSFTPILRMIGFLLFVLLTASGIIELMPFLNSKPEVVYAKYPSPLILALREKTAPQSVFLGQGENNKEIQLAGRKVFLGNYAGQDLRLRKDLREAIINKIYASGTLSDLCSLANENGIDFVEYSSSPEIFKIEKSAIVETVNEKEEKVIFLDTKKVCR